MCVYMYIYILYRHLSMVLDNFQASREVLELHSTAKQLDGSRPLSRPSRTPLCEEKNRTALSASYVENNFSFARKSSPRVSPAKRLILHVRVWKKVYVCVSTFSKREYSKRELLLQSLTKFFDFFCFYSIFRFVSIR